MEPIAAVLVGVLYGAGFYLLLSRNLTRMLFGLVLLGHAANLLIFVAAGLTRGGAPIVGEGAPAAGSVADPIPQALILTAIVIGFGVFAFALILVRRAIQITRSEDVDMLTTTER
jgi:multicomponent Na+:H+ antiporter subunit C